MTVGPWKPISLHTYDIRIVDVDIRCRVSETLGAEAIVNVELSENTPGSISVALGDVNGTVVRCYDGTTPESGRTHTHFTCTPGEIDLWYPVHYGKQPLYTIEVQVKDAVGCVFDHVNLRMLMSMRLGQTHSGLKARKNCIPSHSCSRGGTS